MNLEAINKWLDEEYGCSYTKLEELHDFYFEKYCDLKQENQELKLELSGYRQAILEDKDMLGLKEENQRQKEVIDKLNFIKNRKNQGASQENINKMAIEFVNSYLKEV